MALILHGRKTAAEIKGELSKELSKLAKPLGLGTVLVGSDPGSQSYVAGKHRDCSEVGIRSIKIELPEDASEAEIVAAVNQLNEDSNCTGFIVQLPLPKKVSTQKVLESINPKKDADGLHPFNLGRLVLNETAPLPCTPTGIIELLTRNGISLEGKEVVVIGRGLTVGRPLGLLLTQRKINATVTLTHTGTRELIAHTKRADVVICAIGQAHFLTREMVREDSIVVDVGLTRVEGKLLGDVHPDVYSKVRAYSPVPGGVGPMTRAMLLRNVLQLGLNQSRIGN